jgi:hypothetical protein
VPGVAPTDSNRAARALVAGGALLLLTTAFAAFFSWNDALVDAKAYFGAAQELRAGRDPYGPDPSRETDKAYLYPPAFAALFAPLTILPPLWGYALWMALHGAWLLACLDSLAALCGVAGPGRERQRVGLLAALLVPAIAEIQEGQSNLLALWAVLAGLRAIEAGRETRGAALLALAAQVKLLPAVLIPVLWLQGRREAARAASAWLLAMCLLPALWTVPARGPLEGLRVAAAAHADFFSRVVAPALRDGTVRGFEQSYSTNNSARAVLRRLFVADVRLSPLPGTEGRRGPLLAAAPALAAAASGASLALVGAALWSARQRRGDIRERLEGAGLVWTAFSVAAPTFWEHHLLALALVIGPSLERGARAAALGTVPLAASLTLPYLAALAGWPGPLLFSRDVGVPLLAVLVVFGASIAERHRKPGDSTAACATLASDNKI